MIRLCTALLIISSMKVMALDVSALNSCDQEKFYYEIWSSVRNMQSQGMSITAYDQLQIKRDTLAIEMFKQKRLCEIENKIKEELKK